MRVLDEEFGSCARVRSVSESDAASKTVGEQRVLIRTVSKSR